LNELRVHLEHGAWRNESICGYNGLRHYRYVRGYYRRYGYSPYCDDGYYDYGPSLGLYFGGGGWGGIEAIGEVIGGEGPETRPSRRLNCGAGFLPS
jgi:hypothetical protein